MNGDAGDIETPCDPCRLGLWFGALRPELTRFGEKRSSQAESFHPVLAGRFDADASRLRRLTTRTLATTFG